MLALALWSLWFKHPAKKEPQSAMEWMTQYRIEQAKQQPVEPHQDKYKGLTLVKKSA